MTKVILAPNLPETINHTKVDIFLAGSIEMGKAVDWQTSIGEELSKIERVGTIYSPRRLDWDSSWEQSIDNPQFNEQVNWELDHIELCGIAYFYFDPNTKSPITLMELGYVIGMLSFSSSDQEIVVCCPEGFWRKGNVDIICQRDGITVFSDYQQSVDYLKEKLS